MMSRVLDSPTVGIAASIASVVGMAVIIAILVANFPH